MKYCSNCQETKSYTEFYKSKGRIDGFHIYCKVCSKQKNKEWKKNNKDKVYQYYSSWVNNNKDKKSKNYKNWQINNREKVNSYNSARRALEVKATPKWLNKEQLHQIESLYWLSKLQQELTDTQYHVDHIIPLNGKSVCGLHVPWNLQVLAAKDNLRKSNNV